MLEFIIPKIRKDCKENVKEIEIVRLTPPPSSVGLQQNQVYPTVRKQRIVESQSTADNLPILLTGVIGRWAIAQFPRYAVLNQEQSQPSKTPKKTLTNFSRFESHNPICLK